MIVELRPHVLVLDEEPVIAELMRELLEDEGFRVSTRSETLPNPDEIRGLQPSLIVLDYLRPGQTTGWPQLQRLRLDRNTCAIPVVLCTAATCQVKALESDLAALNVAVVLKPFDIDELLAVVWGALLAPHSQPRTQRFPSCTLVVHARSLSRLRPPSTIKKTTAGRMCAGNNRQSRRFGCRPLSARLRRNEDEGKALRAVP